MAYAISDSSRSQRNHKAMHADGSGSYGTFFSCISLFPSSSARFLWRYPCKQMTEKWSGLQMFPPQYDGKLGLEPYSHKQEYAKKQTKKKTLRKKSPLSGQNFKQSISLSTLTGLRDGPRYGWTYIASWVITNGSAGIRDLERKDQKIVCKAVCRRTSQIGTKCGGICMNFNYQNVHKDICCRQSSQ